MIANVITTFEITSTILATYMAVLAMVAVATGLIWAFWPMLQTEINITDTMEVEVFEPITLVELNWSPGSNIAATLDLEGSVPLVSPVSEEDIAAVWASTAQINRMKALWAKQSEVLDLILAEEAEDDIVTA